MKTGKHSGSVPSHSHLRVKTAGLGKGYSIVKLKSPRRPLPGYRDSGVSAVRGLVSKGVRLLGFAPYEDKALDSGCPQGEL